jgi:hypothetical protein
MKKSADPNPLHARLPCGCKVKIKSLEGQMALVQRLGGWRKGKSGRLCRRQAQASLARGHRVY